DRAVRQGQNLLQLVQPAMGACIHHSLLFAILREPAKVSRQRARDCTAAGQWCDVTDPACIDGGGQSLVVAVALQAHQRAIFPASAAGRSALCRSASRCPSPQGRGLKSPLEWSKTCRPAPRVATTSLPSHTSTSPVTRARRELLCWLDRY